MPNRASIPGLIASLIFAGRGAERANIRPGFACWTEGFLDIHQINTGKGNSALFVLPAGAVVPNAGRRNPADPDEPAVAKSNRAGRYLSVPLTVGDYRIEASASGFKTAVRSNRLRRISA